MSSELDIRNPGELTTYAPLQPLAPAPEWGGTNVDPLRETDSRGGQTLLSPLIPAGVSIAQATAHYKALGDVFASDFFRLGHSVSQIQKTVAWFMDALTNPPAQQQKRHNYNLFEHSNDLIFQAYANFAFDNKFPAKLIQDACWWVTTAGERLNNAQQNSDRSGALPRMAPNSTDAMLDQLSDADYAKVIKINEQALTNTMLVLQQRWGDYTYQQNLEVAQNYLNHLPAKDQDCFDKFTTGWIHMRNTPEFILAMFDAATGAHNLPKDGAGIAREIAECERCMRTNRKQWLSDNALQARYRTLLDLRG